MWLTGPLATDPLDFIRWTSRISQPQVFTVLPDGCRDILVHKSAAGTTISLTDIDFRPRPTILRPGDEMIGYRLRPGLQLDVHNLRASDIPDAIAHAKTAKTDLRHAIEALGTDGTPVHKVAKRLGVSLRSLQRKLARQKMPPPEFWRLLGRARRSAAALASDLPLADIAGMHGYSDQSHMTRACRYWFGHTPMQIRQSRAILDEMNQPALGNWIG